MFPDLEADVRADKADRTSLLIHGFWLGGGGGGVEVLGEVLLSARHLLDLISA